MEVELLMDDTSEDENYVFDDNSEEYLNFEGERCGICSDIVIDRGVLDCCQHWFCFTCIDNWATITSLCPLCQNEFQLITCVPVYDTVGGNKTDDDTGPRDDDWLIEGKNNTLSFPSYYIDENAVVCLDGDGCKIRSGAVAVEEDSDIDTSIACDFCDKWYHAFCVEFDPDSTSDGSWLCPRCTTDSNPQKSDRVSDLRKSYLTSLEISNGDSLAETSFSGRVSVSVADEGETAVVVSLVDRNRGVEKSSESVLDNSKNVKNTLLYSASSMLQTEVLPGDEPKSGQQDMKLSLSQDDCFGSSHSISPSQPRISDDTDERAPVHSNNELTDSSNLGLGFSLHSDTPDMKDNSITEDHVPGSVEPIRSEDPLSAENMEPNKTEVISPKSLISDENETIGGLTGLKRKQRDSSDAHGNANDGEREAANIEIQASQKKMKGERNSYPTSLMDGTVLEESSTTSTRINSRDGTVKCPSEKYDGTSIMDIVQGTDLRSLKQTRHKNSSDITTKERESASGLRLKKIMRRTGDDQDSSVLVQEIRQKIREAVRNKSSDDIRQNLFDPKLLDAFRTALAGSMAENRKPTLDVKAKKALLQKGKVRESLTKKIYGTGGKRRRAWTRECEVEFWKHRCIQASKPEKIETLKSVLDHLRDNSGNGKKISGTDEETKGSILSRLYLADSSVFPRKNDIKPVSALNTVATTEQKSGSCVAEKGSALLIDKSDRNPQKQTSESQATAPIDIKGTKKIVRGMKTENASVEVHRKRDSVGAPTPAAGGVKNSSEKIVASKSGDKRKWALELLARKTSTSGKNMQDKDEDQTILKGNYPLLAQLSKDMRPVLAPARHNKIPLSVRQAQVYRLAEHFLKKATLSTGCVTAETELAVADAVNIEKKIVDRSNSKLVYLNLCSQEILKRPDNVDLDQAKVSNDQVEDTNPSSISEFHHDEVYEENNDASFDSVVEALRKAGLMSDSPPNSPERPTEGTSDEPALPEKNDEEGPDSIFEVDSHPELDIYGDFEYNLEDDDFIGASSLNISNQQQEQPKIKMLFSSLNPEKPNGNLDLPNHEVPTDVEGESIVSSSGLLDSLNVTSTGDSTVDNKGDDFIQKSSVDNDEEPSLAECEELYGPEKEPMVRKYPETASTNQFELSCKEESLATENGDCRPKHADKNFEQPTGDSVNSLGPAADGSKQPPSKREKTPKNEAKQSEANSKIVKKVEAYIKEHIRPLCKSGVITVEQYRWAVGKTTEKVMKYHSKEKNANFLIKEGEKVKKLAEQYVEASQQKAKP